MVHQIPIWTCVLMFIPVMLCLHLEAKHRDEGHLKELHLEHYEGKFSINSIPGEGSTSDPSEAEEGNVFTGGDGTSDPSETEKGNVITRGNGMPRSSQEVKKRIQQSDLNQGSDFDKWLPDEIQEFENAERNEQRKRRYIGHGYIGRKGPERLPNSTVTLVHCEQLIILKERNHAGDLVSCTFSDRLMTPEDQEHEISRLRNSADQISVENSVDKFLDLVADCLKIKEPEVSSKWTFNTLLNGISPGTLWCGLNNLANDLTQLGTRSAVDRCCRTHDLCPVQLHPLHTYKGLVSLGPKTLSHCACDFRFAECLQTEKSTDARGIFHIYFNTLYRKGLCLPKDLLAGSPVMLYNPVDWWIRISELLGYMMGYVRYEDTIIGKRKENKEEQMDGIKEGKKRKKRLVTQFSSFRNGNSDS